jgi:hypothetical protein
MVALHFLVPVFLLGLWLLMGHFGERITSPHLGLWLRGLRGGLLGTVLCALAAVGLAHIQTSIPTESRTFVFIALLLGLSMIGFPIGFLAAMARGARSED